MRNPANSKPVSFELLVMLSEQNETNNLNKSRCERRTAGDERMIYRIYELIGKSKTEPDGYNVKTVTTYKLEEVREWDMKNDYTSPIDAYSEIVIKKDNFKNKTLTILPIIDINWEGEIK